ncbi:CLUMA_CG003630, isoform A [Clunio marinus]|uniref:CLUMA_CG003630, isoform A n=1 Tax=Clunio marinus TaxID=568069 RepID=A0A1J1HQT3_9DIPT|nr:CLUMA_CG003630, isoform A [Clunio marinus]
MQEVTSVQGLSVKNKTIKDVEAFLVYRQNVRIVPDGINKFFPNLKVLVIENSELDSFNQVNKLKKLKYLNLQYNKIEALYNDSFYGLQKLEKIFMSGNKIRKIETETFSNLMNLKLLSLNDNMLHKINENLFRSNPMLASLRFSNNQLNKINVEIFRPLKKLIELNFSGNRCIDDSYPLTISILSEFLNLIDKNC